MVDRVRALAGRAADGALSAAAVAWVALVWTAPRALELAGWCLMTYGLWIAWPPLGWLAGGFLVVTISKVMPR